MNLKIVTLGEVSQTDKDKYYIVSVTCGILKKKNTNELIYKTETDSQVYKTNDQPFGEGRGRKIN